MGISIDELFTFRELDAQEIFEGLNNIRNFLQELTLSF